LPRSAQPEERRPDSCSDTGRTHAAAADSLWQRRRGDHSRRRHAQAPAVPWPARHRAHVDGHPRRRPAEDWSAAKLAAS